jgi:hypothetical protein
MKQRQRKNGIAKYHAIKCYRHLLWGTLCKSAMRAAFMKKHSGAKD